MWYLVLALLVAVTSAQPNSSKDSNLEPTLSALGTTTSILVFLDVHSDFNGTSCTNVNWEVFDLALILKDAVAQQVNVTHGIEIFDTCSSKRRVAELIRHRLTRQSRDNSTLPDIAGVISYSTREVNEIISTNFDQLIIVAGNDRGDDDDFRSSGDLYLEMAEFHIIKMVIPILKQLNWTYISTFYDVDSHKSNALFRKLADDNNICIQATFDSSDVDAFNNTGGGPVLTTGGIVTFTQDDTFSTVAIAPNDGNTGVSSTTGILLRDVYNWKENASSYFADEIWSSSTRDKLTNEYLVSNFNCFYLNDTVSDAIECDNTSSYTIWEHFSDVSRYRTSRMLREAFQFLTNVADDMLETNCTGFDKSCFDTHKPYNSNLHVVNSTLMPFEFEADVMIVHGLSPIKNGILKTRDFINISPPLNVWLSNTSDVFPPSQCTNWCPSCHTTKCTDVGNQEPFDGEYIYVPGDILIAGLLPLSQKWNRVAGRSVCSGETTNEAAVVREAFKYAIQTAHVRYPDFPQNTSIGLLLLDTCNDLQRAAQILLNFESCQYDFRAPVNALRPSPAIVPAYIITGNDVPRALIDVDKLTLAVDDDGNIDGNSDFVYDTSRYNFEAVVHFLNDTELSYVGIVTSEGDRSNNVSALFALAAAKNICIEYHQIMSSGNALDVIDVIHGSSASVVLVFATAEDVDSLFRSLTTKSFVKTWVLMETRKNWLDITSFPLPLGSVIFNRQANQNRGFNQYLEINTNYRPTDVTRMQASDVIKTVDVALNALQRSAMVICGNETTTLCPEFLDKGADQMVAELNNVRFAYQEEMFKLPTDDEMYENYVIYNLQTIGSVEVGRWADQRLILNKDKLKSYSSKGSILSTFRESWCFATPCRCININTTSDTTDSKMTVALDYEMGFVDSTGKFKPDLWVLIVIIIAGTGSLMTSFLMIYILCQVCSGAFVRRYLALGILLQVAMVILFLSVLPFLFTPSETVCGMRYFAHGVAYAFCFGIMLAKMMTLRDYKYIGLGGEISRLNQFLTVFFIVSVQVAIGVQWWVLRTPVLFEQTLLEEVDGSMQNVSYYACDFVREDFIAYNSYVIVLLVLCCLYGISVRKETKNMKEARLLLICSWMCLVFWIAIIVTIIILDRKYLEAICAIGILANALTMVVVIYMPKLTAISRLKYEVSEQNARKENGYKLDTDFQFERPYSLPGTLHSSITDKALTYPRSLATFDTSLSY